MLCHNCGSRYQEEPGPVEVPDRYIGSYSASIETYLRCEGCGNVLLPGGEKEAQVIDDARTRTLEEILLAHSLREFVSPREAAAMLGVSRQAFHRNRRIRRGFIFGVRFGGRMLYLKKSLELFKSTGDGRFPLSCFAGEGGGYGRGKEVTE